MEAPGQWICKLGSLPRILRVHSKRQALEQLDYYEKYGFLTYEWLDEENEIIRFSITNWKEHCTSLQYNYTGIAPTKQEGEKTSGQLHQTDVDAIKKDVVTRTNTLRLNKGVAVLEVNSLLMDAAQVRADEMAASGAYSHTRPDGRRSNTVTDSRRTGENIHCITELYLEQQHKTLSDAVVNLWSNSKGHADNMLNARYGEIGVGLARGTDSNGLACWYCVQVFLVDGCEVTWVDVPAIG